MSPCRALFDLVCGGLSRGVGLEFPDISKLFPTFSSIWGLLPEIAGVAGEALEFPLPRARLVRKSPGGALRDLARCGSIAGVGQ